MKHKEAHMCYGGGCAHPSHFAEGGEELHHSPAGGSANRAAGAARVRNEEKQEGVHKSQSVYSPGESSMGAAVRGGDPERAKRMVYDKTKEARPLGKNHGYFAEGGDVDDEETHPMVSKVMMSRGGMIANDDEPEADSMPADFDDLALDDHLEGTNSGAADGDDLGDEQEDKDRHDIVSRIMKSRSKRDRMPRPA